MELFPRPLRERGRERGKNAFTLAEGATHVGNCANYRKSAFTLAEVLITLAIIGVVAAMTIPTLVADYNAKQWNTAATVFERKLEEALKTMNTQSTLAGHTTTESFVEELSKHFKTNKICQNDELLDCFSETVYFGLGEQTPEEIDMSKIKNAGNFGQMQWKTNIVGVQFANGTSAMIAYNPTNSCMQDPYSNQITGTNCLAILYDTSANKNPNTSGKDLRNNANVTKLGSACAIEINGNCYGTPFEPTPLSYDECMAKKDILGIEYCRTSNDYWGGAVNQCGGRQNMPTYSEARAIKSYLESLGDDYNATLASFGFKYMYDNGLILIWGGDEEDNTDSWQGPGGCATWHILQGNIGVRCDYRNVNWAQGICKL